MRYLAHSVQKIAVGVASVFRLEESLFCDEDGGTRFV
jgi:hypothetical protein